MNKLKRFFVTVAAGSMLFANSVIPAVAIEPWDVTGNYDIDFQLDGNPPIYTHDANLTQTGSSVTGNGGYPATGPQAYHWNITGGSVSGNNINLTMVYDLGAPTTTMHMIGTIASNGTMSGTWTDDFGGQREGTWSTSDGAATRMYPEECSDMTFPNSPIMGTAGSDVINGTSGNDLIFALGGSDVVNGKGGADCIVGGDGSDSLHGQGGNDVILGGNGSDAINGNEGNDWLYGQDGSDSLKGGSGDDQMWGADGSDSLKGDGGDDSADGGNNSDACNAEVKTTCEA